MNQKPAVRTETPTERRLKLQLRRFITLEHLASTLTEKIFSASRNWEVWEELKKQNFALLSYKLQEVRQRATSPQEKQLKATYADVLQAVYAYRKGRYKTVDTSLTRLVTFIERALHATRKDKTL